MKKVTREWVNCKEKRPELVEDFTNIINAISDIPAYNEDS